MPRKVSDQLLISSADNDLVKRIRRLALGRGAGEVLLEGPRVIRQAVAAGLHLDLLALREGDEFAVDADRTVVLARGIFRNLSQTQTPQGVLAIAHAGPATLAEACSAAAAAGWPLVVLDAVQDPGNVGTIARTAAAAGAPSLVVLPGTADPHSAKAIRSSAGHIFNLRVAHAAWEDLHGLRCLGTSAHGLPLDQVDLAAVGALVLGSEAHGLSRRLETVALPMAEGVESLNVAAAAAILLYEVRRRIAA